MRDIRRARFLLYLLSAATVFVFFSSGIPRLAAAEDSPSGFAVLELYTSQGCSSCPPADRLLREVAEEAAAKDKPVYTLSFHVDYWNYLGWTDPYSGKTATDRQRRYAQAFGNRNVYTPQLVVNGSEEFPGTQRHSMTKAIRRFLSTPANGKIMASGSLPPGKNILQIEFSAEDLPANSMLRFALVDTPEANAVPRGENAGSTLSHTSVVRALRSQRLPADNRGTTRIEIPEPYDTSSGRLIVFAEEPNTMRILAATAFSFPSVPKAQ